MLGWAAGGCSDAQIDTAFKKVFTPKRTPQQYMLVAVSDADPDRRREAVVKVAKSDEYVSEWAIKGFVTIALLENDPQTRCVAIRALGRTGDRRAIETCLKILNADDYPPAEVRPPDELSGWDATAVLAELCLAGVPDDLRQPCIDTLLKVLSQASSRHARLAAARGLRAFADKAVLDGLIEALRDEDFAVVYECEYSLASLTGVTNGADPYRWNEWVEAHAGRWFEHRGQLPPELRPPYDSKLGAFAYKTREFFRWLVPEAKEDQ